MARFAFVSMPFASVDKPAIGISILGSTLRQLGHTVDLHYLNLRFAETIGTRFYFNFSNCLQGNKAYDLIPYTAFVGEWMFASVFNRDTPELIEDYINQVLRGRRGAVPETVIEEILRARERVPQFIQECLESASWGEYDFVGFTSTFEQTFASLLLARELKDRFPGVKTGLGGANCEGEMGVELLRQFPFLDAVCLGEGEAAIAGLASAVDGKTGWGSLPGFAIRTRSPTEAIAVSPMAEPIRLDDYPVPNFDEYFKQLGRSPLAFEVSPWLQIEASRGCWWGQKSHCTFCGLNGATMTYRSKSPARVLRELIYQTGRHHVNHMFWVDNILDMKYFKDVIPYLACTFPKRQHFVEVKSNLRAEQVRLLAEAGFRDLQPGIESLSTPILKLMGKGVTAIQNVLFLRLCREFGIRPTWNLLYGFPAEESYHYADQLELLKSLVHLPPPGTVAPLRLDRFSPHYLKAEKFGYRNVRAMKPYRHLFRIPEVALDRVAYYFDYEFADNRNPRDYTREIAEFWRDWIGREDAGRLEGKANEGEEGGVVVDSRFNLRKEHTVLSGWEWDFYGAFYYPQSLPGAIDLSVARRPESPVTSAMCESLVAEWLEKRLLMKEGNQYLALAVCSGPGAPR
jgi:ribosomal peptide maturation radical SAM protein 1